MHKLILFIVLSLFVNAEAALYIENLKDRPYIKIAGSSTVFPFVALAAEQFSSISSFPTPIVESIGSGAGFKMFCVGVGSGTSDIATSSRRMKDVERQLCEKNQVKEIIEIIIGYDGIVIVNSKKNNRFDFTTRELFTALSAYSFSDEGKLIKNSNWSDIDLRFPKSEIEIYGPYKNTGTYDVLIDILMINSCMHLKPFVESYEKYDERKKACSTIRNDGKYIEVGVNENIIIQKLKSNQNAFGIFGFSFLERNKDKVQGSMIAGIEPTYENISSGKYTLSRPLYLYVKKDHINIIPGLKDFIKEVTSPAAVGTNGYLSRLGLIPLKEEEIKRVQNEITKIVI
ncbi:MAG: phosphate ABC transporter substrate-binding protein [Candidatus Mesenet longicola]|uniref:Phosphate ABC transporter substrate-binding protein n=1 Tax=Candidatus Mesenet longicola TaxID=1892558 RepID=A0A8J3MMC1_9RICK|nr:MAG: phosphate ABC transporter substrate-binding protein [Candidatus Mesenet longicola]GHM59779.1 MAG: phosphate ABC transporter substrate-binding protein [Candidatus Mesenet longicola]